jgi:hypothetical protein
MVSNIGTVSKEQIEKYVEGGDSECAMYSWHFPVGTEVNKDKHMTGYPVSEIKHKPF